MRTKLWNRIAASALALCLLIALTPTALLAAPSSAAERVISQANGQNNFPYQYGLFFEDAGAVDGILTATFEVPADAQSGDIYAAILPATEDGDVPSNMGAGDVRYARLVRQDDNLTLTYFRENCRYFNVQLVQPQPDGGVSRLSSTLVKLDHNANTPDETSYTLTFIATMNMSRQLAELADTYRTVGSMSNLSFVTHVRFEPRISAELDNVVLDSEIFEYVRTTNATGEHGYNIECKLRPDWRTTETGETLVQKLQQQMTFTGTVTLTGEEVASMKAAGNSAIYLLGWTTIGNLPARVLGGSSVQIPAVACAVSLEDNATPLTSGVGRWLDYGSHRLYMVGDNLGNFRPDDDITRAEVAQAFYNLLLDKDVEGNASFVDVPESEWCYEAVTTLANLGIVNGTGSGKYDPHDSITRAEFVAIAMRFAEDIENAENPFTDVDDDHWACEYICSAACYGWIEGRGAGTFDPDGNISRCEAATLLNRVLGRNPDEEFINAHQSELKKFPDLQEGAWYYYQVVEATNAHEHTGLNSSEQWTALQ